MEGMTYNELSQGLNNNLGNDQLFSTSGLSILILFILIIIGTVLVFRWYGAREEEAQRNSYKLYKERQKQVARSLPGQQHNRKWFRLRTNAEFQWILSAQAEKAKEKDYKKDRLVDISGDGLCFITAEALNTDDEILIFLDTGEGKNLSLTGRAVRVVEETSQDIIMYNVSVKFGNVLAGERDRVVAWILKRQRAAIREEDSENVSLPPAHTFDVSDE
ncbi:MAG: PilZ domain-containing protein [Syntrophomonas sp.]|nr:PilZ domain-containing protein [Syntrophomonas sp.]